MYLYKLHPNENAYFNIFVGGISGAQRLQYRDVEDSYGNAFLPAVQWLNTNAASGSCVTHPISVMQSIPIMKLNKNLQYKPCFSGYDQKGEYLFEQARPVGDPTIYFAYRYAQNILKPLYTVFDRRCCARKRMEK